MAKRRRKFRNEIVEGMAPAFVLGGGAIGASILGQSLQSKLPPGSPNPLTTTGTTFANFVGPVAVIGAGGIALKQLKKSFPKGKKRKRMKGGFYY